MQTAIPKIGHNVRTARESLSMSQLALAHAMGYKGEDAGAYISRVEADIQQPRISTLQRIARALCVPLEALLAEPQKRK